MRRTAVGSTLLALAMVVAGVGTGQSPAASAPGRGGAPDPNSGRVAAEKIAGRWRITLEGLSTDHQEILASFAVDGDLLLGTLTVGQGTLNISSGKVVGADLSFSFRHRDGGIFKMKGSASERGLQGAWEALNERGKWRGTRLR